MAPLLASQAPRWPPHRREYHAVSRGWIVNELVADASALGSALNWNRRWLVERCVRWKVRP